MSEEQLKAFLAKAQDDSNLQSKLKAAKSSDDVAAIAKEHGYEFSAENFEQMNQQDLEGVAGGASSSMPPLCGPPQCVMTAGTTPTAVPSDSNPTGSC